MELNKKVISLFKTIVAARLSRGEKITQGQIADMIGKDRSHFNSVLNNKRKATNDLVALLEKEFAIELSPKPSVPGNEFNRERAQIKALLHHVAKLEATVYKISLGKSLAELEQDTTIELNDLEHD